jgi:hypothetical protein
MNAHFSTPDPHHRLGDSATRLRALFLKALAALQKPSIVDYAGLLQRGQGLQKQHPQACPTAFSRVIAGGKFMNKTVKPRNGS